MKRHFPGLHRRGQDGNDVPEGIFLVRVDRVFYCHHPQKPFFSLRFVILKPEEFTPGRLFPGGSTVPRKPSGSSTGSCTTSAMMPSC